MNIASKHYLRRTTSKGKLHKCLKSSRIFQENLTADYEIQNLRKALLESQSAADSLLLRLSQAAEAGKQTNSELRAQLYNNMKLQQQLEDERNIYMIEKKQLFDEIRSLKQQLGYSSLEENKYRKLIIEHNQQICELCINFVKTRNTNQALRRNFLSFQKDAGRKIAKLNCRIKELAEALTQLQNAGQFSKPYVKATRRYLELQHDNQCLSRQIHFLQIRNYGYTVEECLSLQLLKHEMTTTEDLGKNEKSSKMHKRKQKRAKKTAAAKHDLPNNSSWTTIPENSCKKSFSNDLISFDDADSEKRPHGDGADNSDVAQLEISESTSTSYFTLKHIMAEYSTDGASQLKRNRSPMRTHSAPDIIKARDIEGLDSKYTCYRKDIGTNT